jgi:hypothetical protein
MLALTGLTLVGRRCRTATTTSSAFVCQPTRGRSVGVIAGVQEDELSSNRPAVASGLRLHDPHAESGVVGSKARKHGTLRGPAVLDSPLPVPPEPAADDAHFLFSFRVRPTAWCAGSRPTAARWEHCAAPRAGVQGNSTHPSAVACQSRAKHTRQPGQVLRPRP